MTENFTDCLLKITDCSELLNENLAKISWFIAQLVLVCFTEQCIRCLMLKQV